MIIPGFRRKSGGETSSYGEGLAKAVARALICAWVRGLSISAFSRPCFSPLQHKRMNTSALRLLFGCLLGYALPVYGQAPDTLLALPEAVVEAPRLRALVVGERVERWDSLRLTAYVGANLGEVLAREGGAYIKSYGLGSLATTSVRGGSAGHTLVLWNGLPIAGPSLGLLDVALLPAAFVDELSLHYGGQSSLWGSGAIGGVLSLDNRPAFGQGWMARLTALGGSFGEREGQAQLVYGGRKLAVSARAFRRAADNDFPYVPAPGLAERRLDHAGARSAGWQSSVFWRPGRRQLVALHGWGQRAQRDIPATLTQTRSEASQADSVLRIAAHWQHQGRRWVSQARAGYFHERIYYQDPALRTFAPSQFEVALVEAESEAQLSARSRVQLGLLYSYAMALTTGYDEAPPVQQQWAAFGAWRRQWRRGQARLSVRQEWINGRPQPPAPALSAGVNLSKRLELRALAARNFRLPTFNDRYWMPGGNPELRPEQGWSQEAGLHLKLNGLTASATAYHRYIRNWILWYPAPGLGYWSAGNVAAVRSRGAELRLSWRRAWGQWAATIDAGYDLALSTNEIALERPRIQAGEQLVYVPRHQAWVALRFTRGGLALAYQHRYTGGVSTLTEPLPAYQLGFARAAYAWPSRRRAEGNLFVQVNNLWNAPYQAVERRPMPGRYFQAGLQLCLRRPLPAEESNSFSSQ
jgi:iron complex outermembrane receptor protein